MKALTFRAEREVVVENVAEPSIECSTDVIVRTRTSAICGSDLHVYLGREKGIEPGTVMGHEFLGEIVETGAAVKDLSPGDRVVSPFTTSCGRCFYCNRGLSCRCLEGQLFGWIENDEGLHGAQSEYVRVPLAETTLVRVPESVDDETALFTGDILATGFFCAEMAEAGPGRTVAVVGCGPVGLFAVIGARERGAETVLAIDVVPERLALAKRFGGEPIDASSTDPLPVVKERTDGRGADAALEAVGSPEAARLAIDLIRPGGILSVVGVHTESRFAFSPVEAYDKNLTYRTGRCPARRFIAPLLSFVARKKYDFRSIVSHRLPLSEGPRGYDLFHRRLEGCTKVVLTF
ncbi:MAG TPA: alcohol dehydrogenase family protein [Vicinamibacteria bacterium]|nr:alcohol dehydrogenase family protein [Vicinamibacteria bacterium]